MKILCNSLKIAFSITILAILASCGGGSSSSSSSGANVTKVVAIGDSMGAGWGGTTPWPSLLAQKLGVPVVNNSARSRTAAIGLSLLPGLLANEKPSHLVVLLGANDARGGDVNGAISNMNAIVQTARNAGVVAIIGTVPPNYQTPAASPLTEQISNGYRGIDGAIIADVRAAVGNDPSFFYDGLHPDNRGQEVIASTFRAAF